MTGDSSTSSSLTGFRVRENVREILSSVAHAAHWQPEARRSWHRDSRVLLPATSSNTTNQAHLLSSKPLPPVPHLHLPHRRTRSRQLKDSDKNKEEGDNSLHFSDTEDDDFGEFDRRTSASRSSDGLNLGTKTTPPLPPRTPTETRPKTTQDDSNMHMLPDEMKEEGGVDMLIAMMGDGFDRAVARRVLRKYDGDIDRAATALLEGERGDDVSSSALALTRSDSQSQIQLSTSSQSQRAGPQGRPNTPVIDLTLDDDPELQRAMQESLSMQSVQSQSQMQMLYAPSQTQSQMQGQAPSEGPVFGPSERPPDPNWAMVPSDQSDLERAIEASLEQTESDALEPFPVEQQLRRDGCPVVLRPSMHTAVYATSIIQGLFYVPQVRQRMASWRPFIPIDEDEVLPPIDGPDYTLWSLSEIFTYMDLARLCDLNVDKRLGAFNIEPWPPSGKPGEFSRKFFAKLATTLEKAFVDQFVRRGQPPPKPRLLHFQYGSSISEPGELLQETSIVPIDVSGGEANDLIGRLSAQLSKPQTEPGKQSAIFEPSEVVAFELSRPSPSGSTNGERVERKLFTCPKSIYLDQFLRENVELAHAKRKQRQEMYDEVQRLVLHKKTLTHFNGKDTLKDLRSTIFYYENVAEAQDDAERAASIKATSEKLKGILATIEAEEKAADEKIDKLRTEAETLLDCAELQQFRYDLRVVFVHDGQYGRKHLYSYVHDKSCWWKIADSLIEKVPEETVLNDEMGLHLNAGPYLLFYSRALPGHEGPVPELPWPDDIKDEVRASNREFLSQLPPELVGDIVIEEVVGSPPGVVQGVPPTSSSPVSGSVSVSEVPGASASEDGMDVS